MLVIFIGGVAVGVEIAVNRAVGRERELTDKLNFFKANFPQYFESNDDKAEKARQMQGSSFDPYDGAGR